MFNPLNLYVVLFSCFVIVHGKNPYSQLQPAVWETNFIPQSSLDVLEFPDSGWFLRYIPLLDVPESKVRNVYYYRWSVYHRHIRYTTPDSGYVITEFVQPVWYSASFDAINGAAGHHIYEGRWLRDSTFLNDYIQFWMNGIGKQSKYSREYSFWVADAAWSKYLVDGDKEFIGSLLDSLVDQWNGWEADGKYNKTLGLYWQVPVWDAMEFTIGSYQTSDPYHGGDGYRPTLNAYQYGDAIAISKIAQLVGRMDISTEFRKRAVDLRKSMDSTLWDSDRLFYFHRMKDNNPEGLLLDGREEVGFIPWYFNMPQDYSEYSSAWNFLFDGNAFDAPYGPTTAERSHYYFMHEAEGCCRWDGPSWPYSTCMTLTSFANLLDNYKSHTFGHDDYYSLLMKYTNSHFKDGEPYVAEALHPDSGEWIYDAWNHSEHYNHATYNDLVLNGLIGIRPVQGNVLVLQPLVPENWDYFAVENLRYHGHLVTVLWDRTGERYGQEKGLAVYQNGKLVYNQAGSVIPRVVRVDLSGPEYIQPLPSLPSRCKNVAANPSRTDSLTHITSSFDYNGGIWKAIDGKTVFDDIPDNRWVTCKHNDRGGNTEYVELDFNRIVNGVVAVNLFVYDDQRWVQTPVEARLYGWNEGAWEQVNALFPDKLSPNQLNQIVLTVPVSLEKVRIELDRDPAWSDVIGVGLTEIEVWAECMDVELKW